MAGSPRDSPDRDTASGCTKSFVEHLEDLRTTVIWCLCLLGVGMAVVAPLAPTALGYLKQPLEWVDVDPAQFLQVVQVTGGVSVMMKIIFWGGLLLALPFIVLAVGWFVFPGLTRRERKAVLVAGGVAAVLFAAGVCMGYFLTLPVAFRVIFGINEWLGVSCEFVRLSDYVSFVLRLLIAFGLAFELPVVVLALGYLGILQSHALRSARRYVIVALLVIAMFLTPPDPITQLMMAIPLIALYEACIWLIWLRERGAVPRRSGTT